MNGTDLLLIVILAAVLFVAVRHAWKRRKSGGCGCGCGCGGCLDDRCPEREKNG